MARGVLSLLLREWGKILLPPLAESVWLGSSISPMLGVTLTGLSGHDISEVSFQTLAPQLTHAQAASEARDAVRITPTFNYSQQPVHTRCHLTSSPVPSQRQRCYQQWRAAVCQRCRCLHPLLLPVKYQPR